MDRIWNVGEIAQKYPETERTELSKSLRSAFSFPIFALSPLYHDALTQLATAVTWNPDLLSQARNGGYYIERSSLSPFYQKELHYDEVQSAFLSQKLTKSLSRLGLLRQSVAYGSTSGWFINDFSLDAHLQLVRFVDKYPLEDGTKDLIQASSINYRDGEPIHATIRQVENAVRHFVNHSGAFDLRDTQDRNLLNTLHVWQQSDNYIEAIPESLFGLLSFIGAGLNASTRSFPPLMLNIYGKLANLQMGLNSLKEQGWDIETQLMTYRGLVAEKSRGSLKPDPAKRRQF